MQAEPTPPSWQWSRNLQVSRKRLGTSYPWSAWMIDNAANCLWLSVRKAFLAGCGTKMGMACGTFHSFQPCRLIVFACGSKNKSNGPGRSKSLKFDHLRDLWQSMAIYGNLWIMMNINIWISWWNFGSIGISKAQTPQHPWHQNIAAWSRLHGAPRWPVELWAEDPQSCDSPAEAIRSSQGLDDANCWYI